MTDGRSLIHEASPIRVVVVVRNGGGNFKLLQTVKAAPVGVGGGAAAPHTLTCAHVRNDVYCPVKMKMVLANRE